MGGETACALAIVGVVLFTLMVFSGVALTNVGPEALIEVPVVSRRSSSTLEPQHQQLETEVLNNSGSSSSSSATVEEGVEYRMITIKVEFDVDDSGELILTREKGVLTKDWSVRELNNKGNGHKVYISFEDALTGTSGSSTGSQSSRIVLSVSEFAASSLGKGLEDCLFGDGLETSDREPYDHAAALSWLHRNKFNWLCPNHYYMMIEKLHKRWQGALLRFLPQILFPPICIFANAISSDAGMIVGVIGSAISGLLMLTGIVIEFSVTASLNDLLRGEEDSIGESLEFCVDGRSLKQAGFSPEMNGDGAPVSAGLTILPLLVCVGILGYVIFNYVRCPSFSGGGSSSSSDEEDSSSSDSDDENERRYRNSTNKEIPLLAIPSPVPNSRRSDSRPPHREEKEEERRYEISFSAGSNPLGAPKGSGDYTSTKAKKADDNDFL